MFEQELLDPLVAVLPRRVDRAEAAALWQVRVGAVLERELDQLVPGRFVLARVARRGSRMDRGRLLISSPLDELQNSVKRVQVVFPGESVPPGFTIPGALSAETSGPVATALSHFANEAQLESIRHLPGVRLHIFPLSLEEILLAFFKKSSGLTEQGQMPQPDTDLEANTRLV